MSAMRCSLFGKLAAKRDFIAVLAPAEFLKVWEPWMQSGLSASRQSLGEAWQTAFLTAPIWRFWLGAEICGATVLGAFMPSVDGMGRYYPLTLFAHAGGSGTAIPPPDIEPQDDWFATAEEFLLSTLDTEVAYDSTIRALEQLSPPNSHALHECPDGMSPVGDDTIMAEIGDQSFSDVFASLRAANHAGTYAVASFWWTLGGGGFQAIGLCCRRMPDPSLQAGMMTGRFPPAMD
jgi:type VI secretion system protein ImpM